MKIEYNFTKLIDELKSKINCNNSTNHNILDFDENRMQKFTKSINNIYFDFSKNQLNETVLNELVQLAKKSPISEKLSQLLNGDKVNFTEQREVLHYALRYNNNDNSKYKFNFLDANPNIKVEIDAVKSQMELYVNKFRNQEINGFTGKPLKYIINIGIGGSDLGPKFVSNALNNFNNSDIQTFYVSNIDPSDLLETINKVNLEQTLFIIASKTFTTLETISNAELAKEIFLVTQNAKFEDIQKHFIAISTNVELCLKFGISEHNIFKFWDWVGGRFSLWSGIGLSIALTIGWNNYQELLEGAFEADKNFIETIVNNDYENNISLMMALIGIYHRNVLDYNSYAVIPYSHNLSMLPEFLQQIDMESNGKSYDINSNEVNYKTASVLWGRAGTNAQHSFFQLLHQGENIIPIDFISVKKNLFSKFSQTTSQNKDNTKLLEKIQLNYQQLLSNYIAQSEALMIGKNYETALNELNQKSTSDINIKNEDLARHKTFDGKRPSTSILLDELSPKSLGTLIAIYENKIIAQGFIWNINSFDQWGVELGKELSKKITTDINNNQNIENYSLSTQQMINKIND